MKEGVATTPPSELTTPLWPAGAKVGGEGVRVWSLVGGGVVVDGG